MSQTTFYPKNKEFLIKGIPSYFQVDVNLTETENLFEKIPFKTQFVKIDDSDSSWMKFFDKDLYKYKFQIKHKSFELDIKCHQVYEEIINSKKLLDYQDDWDDENAIGCNETIYFRAIDFIISYAKFIFDSHGLAIKAPEINLGRDGSIDIEWRINNRSLLLNFLNREYYEMHFYGRTLRPSIAIEGIVKSENINIDLTNWMQNLV